MRIALVLLLLFWPISARADVVELGEMEAGAPGSGCRGGARACFYEEQGDAGHCIVAVRTNAGWHHARVAVCNWMVIGSTPSPTATLQQLTWRDLLPGGGRELVVRFRLAVYERGELEPDGSRPGTHEQTDFLVVCATAGTPACTPALPLAGRTTDYASDGRSTSTSWRRSWRVDRRGHLVLGKIAGRGCPLDPEGMYGATIDC